MWNSHNTADYNGMIAEMITIPGYNGDPIHAYYSRPISGGPHPGIVLIPHMPGWDEFSLEIARRFTFHGYSVVCPNIYERFGHGTPTEVSQRMREQGGVPDESVMGDVACSLSFLKNQGNANGKTGVIGMCSGGRHTFLAACTLEGIDAAVDCWGGGVVPDPNRPSQGKAPIEYADGLNCPLLGIFGNDDMFPTPPLVDKLEEVLKELGKDYTFFRYDSAGHGFWGYNGQMYRPEQAIDSFNKVIEFFDKNLKE